MLGIIIPTLNRSEFVIRQLTYYADVAYKHSVYVADSSTGEHLSRTSDAVRRLGNRIRIVHIKVPQSNDYQATADVLPEIQEPYVCWLGDDDFVIPRAIEECARFLDVNTDYESAHGVGMQFSLRWGRERGELATMGFFPQGSAEQDSPRRRLIQFMGAYWPVCFSVQRIETYREAVDLAVQLPDKGLRELAMSCFPIIRGKAKQLDFLHVIREYHQEQYLLPDSFDWITGPDWQPSFHALQDGLCSELARRERIDVGVAREAFKEAFWSYLSQGIRQKWEHHYGQPGTGFRRRFRRAVRATPGARAIWHITRSFLPGASNQVSLPALLRPTSPYHADFMPIYRAITLQPGASSNLPVSTVEGSNV